MDLLPIHRRKGRGRHKGLDPAFFDLLNQETSLFAVLLDAPLDPPPGPSPWADDAGGTPRTRQQRCSPAPTPRRRPPRSPGWSIGGPAVSRELSRLRASRRDQWDAVPRLCGRTQIHALAAGAERRPHLPARPAQGVLRYLAEGLRSRRRTRSHTSAASRRPIRVLGNQSPNLVYTVKRAGL